MIRHSCWNNKFQCLKKLECLWKVILQNFSSLVFPFSKSVDDYCITFKMKIAASSISSYFFISSLIFLIFMNTTGYSYNPVSSIKLNLKVSHLNLTFISLIYYESLMQLTKLPLISWSLHGHVWASISCQTPSILQVNLLS